MNKSQLLLELKKQMQSDKTLPLRETATNLVFGDGNPKAEIYFLGEAPGKNEDLQGKPFVGNAGKLLDKLLQSIGLKREDIFISNIVSYRPPENRPPTPEEISAFSSYIDNQIKIIDPKIIVTLGRFSLNKFLPNAKISQVHGQPQEIEVKGKRITLIPMYHPSAAFRRLDVKKALEDDFKTAQKILTST